MKRKNIIWLVIMFFASLSVYSQPKITSLNPSNSKNNVALPLNALIITFNKAIVAGPGLVQVFEKGSTTPVFSFPAKAIGKVNIVGLSAFISVRAILSQGKEYYVKIANNAFADASNPQSFFEGITDAKIWSFATFDEKNALALKKLTPANNEVNVSSDLTTLVLTFEKNVQIGGGNVEIYEKENPVPVFSSAFFAVTNAVDKEVSIYVPEKTFVAGKTYYVKISNGSIYDVDNPSSVYKGINDQFTWTFKIKQ